MYKLILTIFCALICGQSYAQNNIDEDLKSEFFNWHNEEYVKKKVVGVNVDKAYNTLLKNEKTKKTVVVAVIDSGLEVEHEDLKDNIWINEDEIPENGIDDDNNGYIDDIHGWNFIGNDKNENMYYDTYEATRIFREKATDYPLYDEAVKMHKKRLKEAEEMLENLEVFDDYINKAKAYLERETGVSINSKADLEAIKANSEGVREVKQFMMERYNDGYTEEGFQQFLNQTRGQVNYQFNVDFYPRKLIIGDDVKDINDTGYGNPNIHANRAVHGTAVSGIIGAGRNNNIGIKGIASDVKIMGIRAVPSGDERDKDIALAIRYAVDNGADIVNMSFGKQFSPEKEFVDDAVRYAAEKGVLLVHGSGNDAKNIDKVIFYPNNTYLDGTKASNFLTIGACSKTHDTDIAASFSNYGKENVDLFAPGVQIVTTDTSGTYNIFDGTSFAAPVVSGVAALILSYYPNLTPEELIDILKTTSTKIKKPKKIYLPSEDGKKKKVKFADLSASGGIVNAYAALIEAKKRHAAKGQ